jgi:hypothetical protein
MSLLLKVSSFYNLHSQALILAGTLIPGIEAGGHGFSSAPPMKTLIASILLIAPEDGPVIIGAGGLATGGHVAELLARGAAGAVLGTRFLLTPESLYSDAHKQALISAQSTTSVRSMAFDQARGTLGWPSGVDGRGLRNGGSWLWFKLSLADTCCHYPQLPWMIMNREWMFRFYVPSFKKQPVRMI